jgi:membrane protein YqaA with SNARE-associated domain
VKAVTEHLFWIFLHLGGLGLLGLGILDSSFLFMPLGNDLLVVALTVRNHARMPYYAAMTAAGSVLGVLLVDLVLRKGGEEGLKKYIAVSRLEYLKCKVKKRAGWALAVASLMPPPFPFTPLILASVALQYPRKKLLGVVAAARLVRFGVDGWLAVEFGAGILRLAHRPEAKIGILVLVATCLGGSAYSIWKWVRASRGRGRRSSEHQPDALHQQEESRHA